MLNVAYIFNPFKLQALHTLIFITIFDLQAQVKRAIWKIALFFAL